jgi:DNA repair exonuclease SbcCD ATPase subunit
LNIIFKQLVLKNFKSHQDITVNFGERTDITGDNAVGKSTIVEAPCYVLYGTDALGGKLDPTPITYDADETSVSLLLNVDGKDLLLGRGLKKGKTSYYINEVPSKAGEFNEVVERLGDKELLMSQLVPNYFFTLHWEKQRALVMQYVSAPANKEVLKKLPDLQSEKLGALLKKHSLSDIEKIHRENKTKMDKAYIAAQSRTKTLKEQLDQLPKVNTPLESLKAELAQVDKQVREKEALLDSAVEKNQEYYSVLNKSKAIQDQIAMSKERWPFLKNEVIEDTCRTCKQPLDEKSVEAVKADKEKRIAEYKEGHSALIKQRNELKEKLAELDFIDVSELREEIRAIDEKGQPLREAINAYSQFTRLQEQVAEAEKTEQETLNSLNDSIFIIDSIKAFKAKEAELLAEKVQALFDSLSIRLFEEQKNGELKNTFEIEKDGKPYRKLSTAEKIRCGLELGQVLSKQSNITVPIIIDNAESITSFKKPNAQLITSTVVKGSELIISNEE